MKLDRPSGCNTPETCITTAEGPKEILIVEFGPPPVFKAPGRADKMAQPLLHAIPSCIVLPAILLLQSGIPLPKREDP